MEYISTNTKHNKVINTLDIIDWNYYIYKQKIKLIDEIDKNNSLDSSIDSFKFNNILKSIVTINVFNISYIAFMTLKFLETSFIPSEILLNVIDIYSDEQMYTALNITNKNINTITINNTNKNYETYNYIKTLKLIITILVKFIIQIEISLNIQCLLITNFIDKINNKNTHINNHTNQNDTFKPKIFKLFQQSNNDICNNIKASTLILLLFKLINKLNITTYETNEYMTYLQETNTTETNNTNNNNLLNCINHKKYINKKTNIYLDTFILEITNYKNE